MCAGTFIVSYPMSLMYLNFSFTLVYFGLFLAATLIGQCILKEREETMIMLSNSGAPTVQVVGNHCGEELKAKEIK